MLEILKFSFNPRKRFPLEFKTLNVCTFCDEKIIIMTIKIRSASRKCGIRAAAMIEILSDESFDSIRNRATTEAN